MHFACADFTETKFHCEEKRQARSKVVGEKHDSVVPVLRYDI